MLVATGNAGKLAEFRTLLQGFTVRSPSDVGLADLQVAETGATFLDNALLKARGFCEASGQITLADDSGLEVDALDGAPGVLSARFGGAALDDTGRCAHLLKSLEDASPTDRTARFRCCLVALAPDGRQVSSEGTCEGRILDAPFGKGGFGYDPVFFCPRFGRSMAALSPAEKSSISHRGSALRSLLPLLVETFPELLHRS